MPDSCYSNTHYSPDTLIYNIHELWLVVTHDVNGVSAALSTQCHIFRKWPHSQPPLLARSLYFISVSDSPSLFFFSPYSPLLVNIELILERRHSKNEPSSFLPLIVFFIYFYFFRFFYVPIKNSCFLPPRAFKKDAGGWDYRVARKECWYWEKFRVRLRFGLGIDGRERTWLLALLKDGNEL